MIEHATSCLRWMTLLGVLACGKPEPAASDRAAAPAAPAAPAGSNQEATPAVIPPPTPDQKSPSTTAPRPPLRRLLTANPETVKRQVPPDGAERVRAYLAVHSGVPTQIVAGLSAHELWTGMTEAEVELSVGPAAGREALPDVPGGFALTYAGEGWVLRFDGNRLLASVVER